MLIEGVDYIIRSAGGLTAKLKGFVCEDADGFYNIYVNKNCSYEQQQETIRHELDHIENGRHAPQTISKPTAMNEN